jgi:hypothetical protein
MSQLKIQPSPAFEKRFNSESPQYAKNAKFCLIKLVAWDVICNSTVIPKVPLTRLLIQRVAVVWIKRKSFWVLCISHRRTCMKGLSEKFTHIGNRYDIRTIFKTKHNLRSSIMKTRPERGLQQTAQCVYSTTCECGRNCTGERGRPLAVWAISKRVF